MFSGGIERDQWHEMDYSKCMNLILAIIKVNDKAPSRGVPRCYVV